MSSTQTSASAAAATSSTISSTMIESSLSSSSSSSSSSSTSSSLTLPRAPSLPTYIDYNATTPLSQRCVDAMMPFLECGSSSLSFGNPSSSHAYGNYASQSIDDSRTSIGACIGVDADDASSSIILTSGATECLNIALFGGAIQQRDVHKRGNHIISCTTEHIAAINILKVLSSTTSRDGGFDVTMIDTDHNGAVSIASIIDAIRPTTILISLMLANNETGTILPIGDIVRAVRSHTRNGVAVGASIWIHTDASQAIGKMIVDVNELDVDMLTIAGHKLYAPKAVGALYVRHSSIGISGGLSWRMHGAGHENNRRAGTENVILAAGLGAAAKELTTTNVHELITQFTQLRDELQTSIITNLDRLTNEYQLIDDNQSSSSSSLSSPASFPLYSYRIHGNVSNRLSNTLSIGFHRIRSTMLLTRLSRHIAASAGAACHSDNDQHGGGDTDSVTLSFVLAAMKVPIDYGMGTIRLSVGRFNTIDEMIEAGRIIAIAVVQIWIEQREERRTKKEAK